MPVYIVTGKLGSGKTLATVGRIRDYLLQGRKVATNLDLNLEKLVGNYKKNTIVYRVPDRPNAQHLENIGLGYDGVFIGEEKNGALVLDECGTWFNARDWNEEGRRDLLNWVIHARKKRWDVFFIVQDLTVLDKQARVMFAEHVVYCRRSDRFNIPFVSFFWKLFTDKGLPLPKVHIGFVRYGDTATSKIVDKWVYRGTNLYEAYDTLQIFTEKSNELYSYLPPYYTVGRYTSLKQDLKNAITNFKTTGIHFFLIGALISAFSVNALVTVLPSEPKKGLFSCNDSYKELYGSCDASPVLLKEKELVAEIKAIKSGKILDPTKQTSSNHVIPLASEQEQAAPEQLLKNVYITGSVKSTSGFDYIFNNDGRSFYSDELGYKTRWVSSCKAILIKDGVSTNIYCSDEIRSDFKQSYPEQNNS
jgi:hypothetical protein